MDPDSGKRWESFQVKIIKDTAKEQCDCLSCATVDNTDETCSESDVLKYCNFASLKMVNKVYKKAIIEFISNSKNGSTASRNKNFVKGSVSSYIASLKKTLKAHFIGKMNVKTFMEKYNIEQLKEFVHKQISKPKGTTPSAMNSNLKGPLQKFYLFVQNEYYNELCQVKNCNCNSQLHVREDITICENCGCGCCNNLNQHSCHDTEGNCRGKLQCKEPTCNQYYSYCLFSKFFSNPNNVLHKTYTSYQCDVCASRETAREKLVRRNKRHLAPKAGPGPVQTVLERTNMFDCVTVKRTNLARRRSKLPYDWNGNSSSRIEEGEIQAKVLQKKEIGFYNESLRFHALVKCTDDHFRYKPGDIVKVHTNTGLKQKGLVNKYFQILKCAYNATTRTCDYRVNDVTNETDHGNQIDILKGEIKLSHEDIKGFYVEEDEIISITSSHEREFVISKRDKVSIVETFNNLSVNLNFENLNYAFNEASISDAIISEREKLNHMLDYLKQKTQQTLQKEREILNNWRVNLPADDNNIKENIISYYKHKYKLKGEVVISSSLHLQVPIERRKKGSKKKKKDLRKKNVRHRGNKQRNAETSGSREYVSSDEDNDELIIYNVEDAQKGSEPNNDYYIDSNEEVDFYSEGEETEENQKADSEKKQKTYKYKNLDHFVKLNNRSPDADEEGETWGASDDEYVNFVTSNTVNGVLDSDGEINEDDFL